MKCRKIRELILSDYIDGELDERTEKAVREHIAGCAGCAAFEKNVRGAVVEPFQMGLREKVPETLWNSVRAAIVEEGMRASAFEVVTRNLRVLLGALRPVYAPAAVVLLAAMFFLAINVSSGRKKDLLNSYLMDQAEFVVSLQAGEGNGYSEITEEGFGTDIEEFLL